MKTFFLLLLAICGVHARSTASSFTAGKSMALHVPRGGAGPLDPELASKAFLTLAGTQGIIMNCGPKKSNEMYGIKNDPLAEYQAELFGALVFHYAALLGLMLVKGFSTVQANQAVMCLNLYQHLKFYLSGQMEAVGATPESGPFIVGQFLLLLFLYTQDYAPTIIKIMAVIYGLSGVQMVVSPEKSAHAWKIFPSSFSPANKVLQGYIGFFLISIGVINIARLQYGATPLQAVGYGSVVWALAHAWLSLSGKFKAAGVPEKPQYFWMALHMILAYTTLA